MLQGLISAGAAGSLKLAVAAGGVMVCSCWLGFWGLDVGGWRLEVGGGKRERWNARANGHHPARGRRRGCRGGPDRFYFVAWCFSGGPGNQSAAAWAVRAQVGKNQPREASKMGRAGTCRTKFRNPHCLSIAPIHSFLLVLEPELDHAWRVRLPPGKRAHLVPGVVIVRRIKRRRAVSSCHSGGVDVTDHVSAPAQECPPGKRRAPSQS